LGNKKVRAVWTALFGELRICVNCSKTFYCSGKCPPNRWEDGKPSEWTRMYIASCNCPECFVKNVGRFSPKYRAHRMTICVFGETEDE